VDSDAPVLITLVPDTSNSECFVAMDLELQVCSVPYTGCSLLRTEGLSCSFDVLYEGLGITLLQ
jgi:hypothetical protein